MSGQGGPEWLMVTATDILLKHGGGGAEDATAVGTATTVGTRKGVGTATAAGTATTATTRKGVVADTRRCQLIQTGFN